jgi:hypothetical protein
MNASQIANVARGAGFDESILPVVVAIALAESSGNPSAYNGRPPDASYGLWQINMYGNLGPARREQFNLSSNEDLFNPSINAAAAYAISNGGSNFRPWATYTSGAYQRYLSAAPVATGNDDSGGLDPGGLTAPLFTIGGFSLSPVAIIGIALVGILLLKR